MCWPTAALISCRTIRRWQSPLIRPLVPANLQVAPEHEGAVLAAEAAPLQGTPVDQEMPPLQGIQRLPAAPILRGARLIESVTSVYFEAGCDGAANGRHIIGGHCELHAAAGFRFA